MLSGEYAVLFGAPAVCAAVERARPPRRATAWLDDAAAPDRPTALALAVARAALARAGRPASPRAARALARGLVADTSALRLDAGGPKLGLGSSAAAAAAMSAVALAALGHRGDAGARLDVALRAHADLSGGRGSGADVAAATLGGVVRVRRRGERLAARPVELPPGLDVRFYFTGAPASTRDLLGATLRRARSPAVERALAGLSRAAGRFSRACARGDPALLLGAVREHVRALAALEAAAGVEIVTPPHRLLAAIAEARAGAAKPSGAGGGDVAVAFAPDARVGAAIQREARRAGLVPVRLRLGAPGAGIANAPRRAPARGRSVE